MNSRRHLHIDPTQSTLRIPSADFHAAGGSDTPKVEVSPRLLFTLVDVAKSYLSQASSSGGLWAEYPELSPSQIDDVYDQADRLQAKPQSEWLCQ